MIKIEDTLKELKIESLNQMQHHSIKAHRESSNVMLLSPTGSGKTLAYLFPLLENISSKESGNIESVIISPTRELALQIESVFRSMKSGIKVLCTYGGHSFSSERRSLQYPPAVLIATPGRLLDHIERGTVDMSSVNHIILDEFDKSLELGFLDEIEDIFKSLTSLKKRTLISATSNIDIPYFIGFEKHHTIDLIQNNQSQPDIDVDIILSDQRDKLDTLYNLLSVIPGSSSLIFCNYRESAERISDYLWSREVGNEFFHGGMEQIDRERSLIKLKNGSTNILISTDLASRGIDVDSLDNIIHYHLPQTKEAYIHRNGRTARMNKKGNVYVIYHNDEELPEYIISDKETYSLDEDKTRFPKEPIWQTLYIGKGKKDKISKSDVVGFLIQKGDLTLSDVGIIDIKDYYCYVAIKSDIIKDVLTKIKTEKIKNTKCKFDIAF